MHQNIINEENATEMDDAKVHEDAQNYEQMEYDDNNDDAVSIENKSNDDTYISIKDLNTIEQINTAKINSDPETSDELPDADEGCRTITNHRYNLRPRPTQ